MKPQHNWTRRLLALTAILFVCTLLFASCNSGDNQPAETSAPTEAPNHTDETKPTDNASTDKGTDDGNDQTEPHVHAWNEWTVTAEPTCTEKGEQKRECACGEFETQAIDAKGHTYASVVTDPTCTEKGYTTYTCACGDTYVDNYVTAAGHTFGEWETTKEATCTENGEQKRECACGEIETQVISATGHIYNAVITQPTCTEKGFTTYTCDCGTSYIDNYVSSTDHTFGEWETTKEVTCTENGQQRRECACGEVETKTITTPGHIYNAVVTKPTCTEQGYTTYSCVCGDTYVANYVSATDHTYGEWKTTKEATKTEDGFAQEICSGCGMVHSTKTLRATGSIGLVYTKTNSQDYWTVTGIGKCTDTDIVIPQYYKDIPVLVIGENAFSNCATIKNVVILNGITTIDNNAFFGCTNLTTVTIPDSVTSIGNSAFDICRSLTSFNIPDSVTSIGSQAFATCRIVNLKISRNLTSIGTWAFYCDFLETISVDPENTKYRSEGNCLIEKSTNSVILGCNNSVIPDSVTSIGDYAFQGCTNLTSIIIPNSVTNIGTCAFNHCDKLTNVTIGKNVASIGDYAFSACYSLVEVYNLSSLYIPAGSTLFGGVGLYALNIYTSANEPSKVWATDDGFRFYEDGNVCYLLGYSGSKTDVILPESCNGKNYAIREYAFSNSSFTSVTIPNSVTSIGDYAFNYCSSLTSITIPDGVTSIGDYAFNYCSSLTTITISDSVTSIGDYAFYDCSNLASITIPDSVTSIGIQMFYNCDSLTSITIPHSVTKIGNNAFRSCDNLTSITFEGTSAQWNAVTKGKTWNYKVPATKVICSDGVVSLI